MSGLRHPSLTLNSTGNLIYPQRCVPPQSLLEATLAGAFLPSESSYGYPVWLASPTSYVVNIHCEIDPCRSVMSYEC